MIDLYATLENLRMTDQLAREMRLDRTLVAGIVKGSCDHRRIASMLSANSIGDADVAEMIFEQLIEGVFKRLDVWGGLIDDGRMNEAERIFRLAATGGPYVSANLAFGAIEFIRGNDTAAFEHYRRVRESRPCYVAHPSWGAYTLLSPEQILGLHTSNIQVPDWLGSIAVERQPVNSGKPLVIIPCDDLYLFAFAERELKSMLLNGIKELHFHLYNPTAAGFGEIDRLRAEYPDAHISCSSEHFQVDDLRGAAVAVRYIRLAEFLRAFGRPILLIDADVTFRGNFIAELEHIEASYGIKRFKGVPAFHPWRKVSGGFVYVKPDRGGVQFATLVSRYLSTSFNVKSDKNWWSDQAALHYAHELIFRYTDVASVNLLSLSARLLTFQTRKNEELKAARKRLTGELEMLRKVSA